LENESGAAKAEANGFSEGCQIVFHIVELCPHHTVHSRLEGEGMEKQRIRVREPEARPRDPDMEQLVAAARILVEQPEVSRSAPGFIGFNKTKPGDRVLIAGDTHTDPRIVEAIRQALRERGAKVDFYSFDAGEDREIEETDEIGAMMRRGQWWDNPSY